MKRLRPLACLVVIVLVATACGSGKKIDTAPPGSTSATTAPDVCKAATLKGSEVGVSPTTITVSVVADTGSPLRPGLFQGSVDGVEAWAKYINATGGLACRKVVVKALDSHLAEDNAENAVTTACGNSLALVGTTAVFLDNMKPVETCKDHAGAPVGMPDLAVFQTYAVQQCSKVSFSVVPYAASCPYSGTGVRTFTQPTVSENYYFAKYGKNTLHGLYLVPSDLPSTISSTTPIFAAVKKLGVKEDAEFGISGLTPQSGYTPYVTALETHNSTYARNGSDYVSNVFLRKEAQVQGVNTVKVWDCGLQCYDHRLITTGGPAVEGQYVWLSFLPYEDKGKNAELDNFLEYDTKPDAFGTQAWVAGQIFATAVRSVVAKSGPNGLTRAALLTAIRGLTNYDDNGFIAPTNIGGQVASKCLVGLQVQHGAFVRIDPVKPGTFDCTGGVVTESLDPVKAFKG
jgi:hypothetical protein